MSLRSLATEDYLDVWRGAFYGVILGIFLSATVFKEPSINIIPYITFLSIVTFYILLDGITHYNDRIIVRRGHQGIPLYIELFLLFLEMLAMLILTLWAVRVYQTSYESFDINRDIQLLGILGLINFLHNCLIIFIDKNWGKIDFIFSFIVGMPEKAARNWMYQLEIHKKRAMYSMQQTLLNINHIGTYKIDEPNQISCTFREVSGQISRHYAHTAKSLFFMCFLNIAMQYSVSRLWIFNLLLSIRLLWPDNTYLDPYLGFSSTEAGDAFQWSFALLAVFFYIISSYQDLNNDENDKKVIIPKYIANVLFFLFMLLLVLGLQSANLVFIVFIESTLFTLGLIIIADHTNFTEEERINIPSFSDMSNKSFDDGRGDSTRLR